MTTRTRANAPLPEANTLALRFEPLQIEWVQITLQRIAWGLNKKAV